MGESSLLFSEESPVLSKPIKKLSYSQTSNTITAALEQMHDRLLQHLKNKSKLSRQELTELMEQTNSVNPDTTKARWLLMKIRGLLTYVLKKRGDFQGSLLKGDITILDKSFSQGDNSFRSIPESPRFQSLSKSEFPSKYLTNNDFFTMEEVENIYNCSEDLFSDSVSALYQFSQQNYDLMKNLTSEDKAMKTETGKTFERMDEEYKAMFPSSSDPEVLDVFDNLTITNEELTEEFEELFNKTEAWVGGIMENITHLEEKKSVATIQIEEPETVQYNQENLLIVRQIQNEFKKKLVPHMSHEDKADVLNCLFGSSDFS